MSALKRAVLKEKIVLNNQVLEEWQWQTEYQNNQREVSNSSQTSNSDTAYLGIAAVEMDQNYYRLFPTHFKHKSSLAVLSEQVLFRVEIIPNKAPKYLLENSYVYD